MPQPSDKESGKDSAAAAHEWPAFVHLRVHTAYSLLEGALTIPTLAKLALADQMPAIAMTDSGNLFGTLEFSEKMAGCGIQPIIGCTLKLAFASERDETRAALRQADSPPLVAGVVALLAKDGEGYANLMRLASLAYLESGEAADPFITRDQLAAHQGGLIALTGGPDGVIDLALADRKYDLAKARLLDLRRIFSDRLYVELQRHGMERELAVEPHLIALAYDHELPLVATNEPYFASAADYEAHDALICIAEGSYVVEDERRRLTPQHSFKTRAAMVELFADLPEAIANTIEIARRCAFRPRTRAPILPQFVSPAEGQSAADQVAIEGAELTRQAEEGLRLRLESQGTAPGIDAEIYWKRLAFELDVITSMKFPGYFLIVSDFIKWAKAQGIPVGPGRGSGAGSVVAWALTITDLDPLRFGLLFERFLNPERVSMPDFDIDFCQDRRDEVIRYVQGKYGSDRVAQIITYGKLQARAVLRDVGRVLQLPYGQVNDLCKLVPNNPANPVTLEQAINDEPRLQDLRDNDEMVAQLLTVGLKLEGLYRHASTHAAGVVIGDRPLSELVPLYRDPRSDLPATQFNMKWVEAAGLVKFDFLGLKTLTVIEKAVDFVRANGTELDLSRLGIEDPASYQLLARGDTVGVFQLESTGMRDSLRKLRPDRFEDIIAMVSLYRPGPMDNIPTYISRKHGLEKVEYPHAMLEPILNETYGVIIYQEQVMQIAQVLSGYSLGEADLLRRAMGKKIKEEMAKQRQRFVEGALKNGVVKAQAENIFELVDKFAGYGFNKSHAAAYALLAYQTAYLKANHPVEFLAATMTLDLANTDKLAQYAEEARDHDITVLPPCVNASLVDFSPENGAIRYSLAALKNFGRGAAEHIVAGRLAAGPYRDLASLARRLDPHKVGKRNIETLAAAGAFDTLETSRAMVHGNADNIIAVAQRTHADAAVGQNNLFAGGGEDSAPLQLRKLKRWTPMEVLTFEHSAIGFYLSGHPLDQFEPVFDRLGITRWADFEPRIEEGVAIGTLAAIVLNAKERRSKKGKPFAFAAFSDQTGQFEAVLFSETLAQAGNLLKPGRTVLLNVEAEREGDAVKVRVQSLRALDQAAAKVQNGLVVVIDGQPNWSEIGATLNKRGQGEVQLRVRLPEAGREVTLKLPDRYEISPMTAGELRAVPGVLQVLELGARR